MDEYKKKVRGRLERVWERPNFRTLFETAKKHPVQILRKGTILFNEGDPLNRLYYIVDGYVKIYRLSEEGKETTSYLLGPGSVLGIRTLLSEEERTFHIAEAFTSLKVMTISRKECFDQLAEHPELLIDMLHIFADRLSFTEKKYESFVYANTTARVAIFLTDVATRFGQKKGGTLEIMLELTHQRIADFVGAFRETVTLALHRLEDEGIIKIERAKVIVKNIKRLEDYASFRKKA